MAARTAIEGWMGRRSLAWLRRCGEEHDRIIEVGCWKGRSTKALAARNLGAIVCVDTWAGVPGDPDQETLYPDGAEAFRAFRGNLSAEIADGRVIVKRGRSEVVAAELALEIEAGAPRFDMVFIDADHSYEAVVRDIEAYQRLLVPGGLLAGHDYGKARFPGVTRAVDELVPEAKRGPGSIWWARR